MNSRDSLGRCDHREEHHFLNAPILQPFARHADP
jgi:hypothetical protein